MSARDFDAAWDRALDAGLCRDAAADYAYDVWCGAAPAPVTPSLAPEDRMMYEDMGLEVPPPVRLSDGWLEANYGDVCRRRSE